MNSDSRPFITNISDDAETPLRAYKHIEPILSSITSSLGKNKEDIILYDPYYCCGTMKKYLATLGYTNVINEPRDFYHDIQTLSIPYFDILITNPPFSGDHIIKLLDWILTIPQPTFLLLPQQHLHKSHYYSFCLSLAIQNIPQPFFIGPVDMAYDFLASTRTNAETTTIDSNGIISNTGNIVKPGCFQCIWIICGKKYQIKLIDEWKILSFEHAKLCFDYKELPLLLLGDLTPRARRWRKKQKKLLLLK